MIWVGAADMPSQYFGKTDGGNRLGSFLGVMGQSDMDMSGAEATIDAGDRLTAISFGRRVAEAAQRWYGTKSA